jgi:hypothetical protein
MSRIVPQFMLDQLAKPSKPKTRLAAQCWRKLLLRVSGLNRLRGRVLRCRFERSLRCSGMGASCLEMRG